VRGNLLPLHEIASTDKASLAMTYEGCHSMPSVPCHSDPERSEGEESNSVQGKLYEESHSAQDRLLRQSQEIATPRQVGVDDDRRCTTRYAGVASTRLQYYFLLQNSTNG